MRHVKATNLEGGASSASYWGLFTVTRAYNHCL